MTEQPKDGGAAVDLDAMCSRLEADCLSLAGYAIDAAKAEIIRLTARVEELEAALIRQSDNLAFVINHVALPDAYLAKFIRELEEDRAVLSTPTEEPK